MYGGGIPESAWGAYAPQHADGLMDADARGYIDGCEQGAFTERSDLALALGVSANTLEQLRDDNPSQKVTALSLLRTAIDAKLVELENSGKTQTAEEA